MIDNILQNATIWVETIRELAGLGILLYAIIFLVLTLLLIPATPLTAIAGFLYGPVWGTLLISPLGIISASIAFLIGRTVIRPWVKRRIADNPTLEAIDKAVEHEGKHIVLLLRLSSVVPFAPLSYLLGASRLSLRDFVLTTWVGLLPGTFLYAYLGSLVASVGQILTDEIPINSTSGVLTWIGFLAAVLALFMIVRFARQAIYQSITK